VINAFPRPWCFRSPWVVRHEVVKGAAQAALSEQDEVSSAGELHPRALPEPTASHMALNGE
jgi:hypothetical protein